MADAVDDHVSWILRSHRIKNKLVVLCEGDRLPILKGQAPSPQQYAQYARLERTPDANFYGACVPVDWHGWRLPRFFNCGGRSEVLRTYRALLAAHRARPEDSYLDPEKLYALIDLDIQAESIPFPYRWTTTEDVHQALYHDGAL